MASGVMIAGFSATLAIQGVTLVGMVLESLALGRIGRKTGSLHPIACTPWLAYFVNACYLFVSNGDLFVDVWGEV